MFSGSWQWQSAVAVSSGRVQCFMTASGNCQLLLNSAGKIHTLRLSFPNAFEVKFLEKTYSTNLNRNFTLFAKKFFKR